MHAVIKLDSADVSSDGKVLFDLITIMHVQQQSLCRGHVFSVSTSVFYICTDICFSAVMAYTMLVEKLHA